MVVTGDHMFRAQVSERNEVYTINGLNEGLVRSGYPVSEDFRWQQYTQKGKCRDSKYNRTGFVSHGLFAGLIGW